jgi:serine/threonine protein kinase
MFLPRRFCLCQSTIHAPTPVGPGPQGVAHAPAPPVLPGYEVIRQLGKGGSVWLAEATASGLRERVAVRVGRPEISEGLLLREITSLSRVRSPHVAAYRHCLRTADGACAVVTEYVPGKPLAAVLAGRPDGRLPWRPPPPGGSSGGGGAGASSLIMGVLRGLAALHAAEPPVVHRRVILQGKRERQSDRQAGRQTGRQKDSQTDRHR